MRHLTAVLCALTIAAMTVPARAQLDPPTLTKSTPAALTVSTKPTTFEIFGTGFENEGHTDRDQYMHWQVRHNDSPWQRCYGIPVSASGPAANVCGLTGWSGNEQEVQLGSAFTAQPGYVEFRFWHGLGVDGALSPDQGAQGASPWSNVIRIAVVTSSAAMQKIDPNSVRVMASPTPAPVLVRGTMPLSPELSAVTLPAPTTLAKTTCPSTYVYQKPGGDALLENGAPVVLQRDTDVRVSAKPTGLWATIVRGEHAPPAYVRANCLSASS